MQDVTTPAMRAQDLVDWLRREIARHEQGETTLREFYASVAGRLDAHDRRRTAEGRGATLGTVSVSCTRCGEPRWYEVRGRVSTVERPGWSGFNVQQGGEEVGRCYLSLYSARGDDHSCTRKPPTPRHGLRAV